MITRFVGLARAVGFQRSPGTGFVDTFKPVFSGRAHLYRHLLAVAILLVIGLVAASRLPRTVHAIIVGCRGDPVIFLSNGQQIRVSVQIATDASNVDEITYTVHAPEGIAVERIVVTGGALASKEVVDFQADLGPNQYATETVVSVDGEAAVPVTARTAIRSNSESVSGYSGEALRVDINLGQ